MIEQEQHIGEHPTQPCHLANVGKAPIEVYHCRLTRSGEGPYKSCCPCCPHGMLLIYRGQDYKLRREDRCVCCAQAFRYLDEGVNDEKFLPAAPQTFDGALAVRLMHFMSAEGEAMRTVSKSPKPDGLVVVTVSAGWCRTRGEGSDFHEALGKAIDAYDTELLRG